MIRLGSDKNVKKLETLQSDQAWYWLIYAEEKVPADSWWQTKPINPVCLQCCHHRQYFKANLAFCDYCDIAPFNIHTRILTSNLVKNQFLLFCLSGSSVSFRQIICSLYITPTFHTLRPTLTERSELSLRIKMWHQQSCLSNLFCFLASHKLQWPWKSGDIFLIVFRQFDRPLDCVYWKMNIYPKIHHCHWPLQCIGFFCLYRV